jgi:hypothetical protein
MNTQRMLLAAAALALGGGAMGAGTARAQAVTLYTPIVRAGHFACNAVNVSRKYLTITISILDGNGQTLAVSPSPIMPTAPGSEAANDFGAEDQPMDAYCVFTVAGSRDRDDLRAVLNTTLIRTFDEGSETNIPVLLARTVAAQ